MVIPQRSWGKRNVQHDWCPGSSHKDVEKKEWTSNIELGGRSGCTIRILLGRLILMRWSRYSASCMLFRSDHLQHENNYLVGWSFCWSAGFLRRRGHRKGWENLPHSGQVRVVFNLWSHKGTDFFITWRERDIYLCPYWSKFIEIYDLVLFSWNNSAIPKYQLPCTSWWVWTLLWQNLSHSCRNNDGNLEEDEFIKVTFNKSSWKISFFHVPWRAAWRTRSCWICWTPLEWNNHSTNH